MTFTSESVTEGHPDKVADQISDSVLDAYLAEDPDARVAVETLVTRDLVVIAGEVTSEAVVDVAACAREVVRRIGYTGTAGFDADTLEVIVRLGLQSPDIARGVSQSQEARAHPLSDGRTQRVHHFDTVGAGDQGLVFGYAVNETPELMPAPIMCAHALTRRLAEVRHSGVLSYLGPDGKAQVTVSYEEDALGRRRPKAIERVLISTQHAAEVDQRQLWADLLVHVLPALPQELYDASRYRESGFLVVNPAGPFVLGGPAADTGLTGRKIIVDTYGGRARHGGGAFSGKDPTKVDRSGAYAARQAAKAVVAAGLAYECELAVAYAIGQARPWSVTVDCFGTAQAEDEWVSRWVQERFDLRPAAIIERLDLRQPIYAEVAKGGSFGGEGLPWEEDISS